MGRIDLVDQCDLAYKGILLLREELASRSLEDDRLRRIIAIVYHIQLHWLRFGCEDLQGLPLNEREIPSAILLPIQQQTNLHSNRHDGSHKQLNKNNPVLAFPTAHRP